MLKRIFLFGLTFAVIGSMVSPAAAAQERIVIGQSAPLSGENAAFGGDIRDGALAYFKAINDAGGINGRKIELVTMDDGNDRTRAGQNATKLLDEKDAVALFGFASATLSLDALPMAEQLKVPVFATFTGASVVRKSPVVFTIRPTYEEEMDKILDFWQANGIKRVTVFHYDDEVGLQNLKAVEARVKQRTSQPVVSVSIKRNAVVGDETIQAVITSDPQLLLSTVASKPAATLLEGLRKNNKYYWTSSSSFVGSAQFIKLVGSQGAGISITQVVPSPTNTTIPVVAECARAMKAAQVKEMNYTNLEACIAAKILVEGIRKAGKNVSRATLLKSLQSLGTYDTGGFNVTFTREFHHGSRWTELSVITKVGGFKI
jgi:branched-chain amino acid transport system substrate-binding protein